MFRSCLGLACSLSLEGVPCNSDLYVYLNTEVGIGLVQWKSFAAMPSRTSNPLSSDGRRHIGCV